MRMTSLMTLPVLFEEIGERLERHRLDRNLTQEQLAAEAGIGRATVARLESGSPVGMAALFSVLKVLGLVEALNAAIPAPSPSPIQQLDAAGRLRQRARPTASRQPTPRLLWADVPDDDLGEGTR